RSLRDWSSDVCSSDLLSNAPKLEPIEADGGPLLSVIVIAQDDAAVIGRSLATVMTQECADPFEVIVVTSGTDRTADVVRSEFPRSEERRVGKECRSSG